MNLKGGYKILLLSTLSLVEVATAITDKKVIEQLSTLIGYMGKKELKPILIHCGIEKDSKVTKHCVMGELKKISDTEYVIIGKIDKAYLTISVEFSQDEETEEYYIASGDATYILSETTKIGDLVADGITSKGIANTGGLANIGDVAISGDLDVSGEDKGVITANAVIQKPRYSFNIDLPNVTGMTKTQWYTKMVVIGNELHIIGNARYVNNTESAISFRLAAFTVSNIPEEIGKLIYDENGDTLEKSPVTVEGGSPVIRISPISLQTTTGLVHGMRLSHSDPNQIQIYHNQTANVGAGASVIIGFHITLELE